jgi:hypothetical protein
VHADNTDFLSFLLQSKCTAACQFETVVRLDQASGLATTDMLLLPTLLTSPHLEFKGHVYKQSAGILGDAQ